MSDVVHTVMATSMAELRATRDAARTPLVELRLDGVDDLDVAGALQGRRTPVVVTCRAAWEGGRFAGSEEERLGILQQAVALGAEYVDVEWKADRRGFASRGTTRLVVSHHDFTGLPSDLDDRVRAMRGEDADVVKVAVTAHHLRDCLTLRDAMRDGGDQVAIAMGRRGQLTRICPWLFQSIWTFAGASVPGQTSVEDLIDLYRVPAGSSATAIYVVVGAPLGHSASPAMHNAGFAALGLDATYLALETADVDEFFEVADAIGLVGASVTVPLKAAVFARIKDCDEVSRQVGAANTLTRSKPGWKGGNSDVAGFLAPLAQRGQLVTGARAVVLGAGGAARAAVWALAQAGMQVEVSARDTARAMRLATDFGAAVGEWPPVPGWRLLVNATPVGMWPNVDAAPIDRDRVQGDCVYDLVYNPLETRLIAFARDAGIETIDGLEMLVAQAASQFEHWTGRAAPRDAFRRAAEAFVAKTSGQTT